MISVMMTIITMTDLLRAQAKRRAAELGFSFAELTRRLFEKELSTPAPQSDIDSICGMVTGTPFDMAVDRERIIGQAADSLLTDGRG